MATDYVKSTTATTYRGVDTKDNGPQLLWGDPVQTFERSNGRVRIQARGEGGGLRGYDSRELWVKETDLGGEALLEVYFIDVGQGDGVLVVTPDRKHVLVDGGAKRANQPTGKNAADFVDWKFFRDYRKDKVTLDAMVISHLDADHFGGLSDLLDPAQRHGDEDEHSELDVSDVRVDQVLHPGLAHWQDKFGPTSAATDGGKPVYTRLLGSRNDVFAALKPTSTPKLREGSESRTFWQRVVDARNASGRVSSVKRVDASMGQLDLFGSTSKVKVHTLAPILTPSAGGPGLRDLGDDGVVTNGHSVMLRLDYGKARILLTGDLNKASQKAILAAMGDTTHELSADVAKACHHGSSDVSFPFLAAVHAGATVISSGDSEGYGHPQADIVAASSVTGNQTFSSSGDLRTPLVYSTEISRSVGLGRITGLSVDENTQLDTAAAGKVIASYTEVSAGDLRPKAKTVALRNAYLAAGIVYGLVNVRTNGTKILCATRDEKSKTWDTMTFDARFSAP